MSNFNPIRHARHTLYNLLHNTSYDARLSRYVDFFLVALIITNVVAVIIESVDAIYYSYQFYFQLFEDFSLLVFSIEYLLRLWSIIEERPGLSSLKQRLGWIKSPSAIIDLVAILPGILNLFLIFDLRFLRILRLFRLLKLTRYFASMRIILVVLSKERGSFQAVIFILFIMIVIASSGIYLVENRAQPAEFESIPRSMWWAIVTLTTVGYGDVVPMTTAGKVFGAIMTILGVGLAALPAGILASGLASELNYRREELEHSFREMLTEEDLDILNNQRRVEQIRKELGLPYEVAQEIVLQVIREQNLDKREKDFRRKNFCPHCGEGLE